MATVNITLIANELKIAPSTVSRALKKPEMVSPETRQKVLKAAEKLGYLQKLRDNATVGTSHNLVGVIVADLTNFFSNQIVKAVNDLLLENKISTIVGCTYENSALESNLLKQWAGLNLKGLIVMPTNKFSKSMSVLGDKMPVVLVDREDHSIKCDTVIEDNCQGSFQALEYLRELGHKKIAFISGNHNVYTFAERCRGAEQSPLEVETIELKAQGYEELYIEAFEQTNIMLMRSVSSRPTAIVGANNAITAGVLYALSLKGLKIPQDMSVISYGDNDWCRFYPTPITSVCQPVEEMGRTAAQLLLDRIQEPTRDFSKVCLKSMLLNRASTDKPNR